MNRKTKKGSSYSRKELTKAEASVSDFSASRPANTPKANNDGVLRPTKDILTWSLEATPLTTQQHRWWQAEKRDGIGSSTDVIQTTSNARNDSWIATAKHTPPAPPVQGAPQAQEKEQEGSERGKKHGYQGLSTFMKHFLNPPKFVGHLFRWESNPDIETRRKCQFCNIFQCTTQCRDCLHNTAMCRACFIQTHKRSPLHWCYLWKDENGFFEKHNISDLGFVITLGHRGERCPSVDYTRINATQSFRIVDMNGIHQTRIAFCNCRTTERYEQLLEAGIFPATHEDPKTGFTFNLLDSFNIESLVSKKSAYDFVTALRRRTNWEFPEDVPDVYPQFRRVIRVWRALKLFQESGQANSIDVIMQALVPGWAKRSVMVPCFACPQPGFNMDDDVMNNDEFRHLFTLFLSADGHFSLQRKKKPDDPDDVALVAHMGLFADILEYRDYCRRAPNSTEKSTCAKLKAAQNQNKAKFAGIVTSGVVAVTCARHSMFLRHGMVDLEKGEKFASTNFALVGALFNLLLPTNVVLTYDIACLYSICLLSRFNANFQGTKYFEKLKGVIGGILHRVPKMHLQGHIADCQYRWSLNYTPCMGRTCGEGIEGSWAEAKQAGGMTKEMNAGHCADTLTALQNDWNLVKMQKLRNTLYRQLTNAKATAVQKLKTFMGLSKLNGQQQVEELERLSTEPYVEGGHVRSVYRMKEDKVSGQGKVLTELLEEEERQQDNLALDQRTNTPLAFFVNRGIKLQQRQFMLREQRHDEEATDADKAQSIKSRMKLRSDIDNWRLQQKELCHPGLVDLVASEKPDYPEEVTLYLPLDLATEQREKFGMQKMAQTELRLRKGEANDALRKIRDNLQDEKTLYEEKNRKSNHNFGVKETTRSWEPIKAASGKVRQYRAKYDACRKAMLALGLSEKDQAFQPIRDKDVFMKNTLDYHALGEGSKTESWLWGAGDLASLSETERSEFAIDRDRVQWFRVRADMQCWQEEVEILSEEFRQAVRGLMKMAEGWQMLSVPCHELRPSFVAYAKRQAYIYRERATRTSDLFIQAGGTWPAQGVRLADHVRREQPSQSINWVTLKQAAEIDNDVARGTLTDDDDSTDEGKEDTRE
ncbi:hypothetical protein VNI00_003068 [Paramarasmius palmivorus]|uniref:CxC2-like cysteine cluster KDZ transposase-associated domain-containing protein n=1 Tax=Paramarasmius palmivorus TaxID=297713 RepID=A0AAW0DXR2_9AGAR